MHDENARFALPFWGLLAFALWSPVSIAGANIAWVAALVLWAFLLVRDGRSGAAPPRRTALDPGFVLLLVASLISLCVSLDLMASLKEFRSLGLIVVYYLFAWNVKSRREARLILSVWLALSALAAAYGAVEYFSGWDAFGHYDPHRNKIGGFFSMHLTFSEYLLLALCMCIGVLLWARPASRVRRAFLWAVFGIILFGFLLARAKGAYLGLLAGMGVIGALKGRRALTVMGAVVLTPLVLLAAWNAEYLYTHFLSQFLINSDTAAGYVHSNTQRLFMWWTGFRISPGHFLNGVGLHAVEAVYPDFRHAMAQAPNQWHLHSNFMQLGVTRGLFGLSTFLYLFLLAGRNGLARFWDSEADPWERALAGGALGACAAFLVSGLTEYSWGDSEVLMAFYMVLGLALSVPAGRAEKAPPLPAPGDPSPSWMQVAFSGLLITVCLSSMAFPASAVNTGTRALEALLGFVLCGLAAASFLFRRMQARTEETGPRHQVPDRSIVHSMMVAGIVTFAGYSFTRHLWENSGQGFCGPWLSSPIVILPAFFGLLLLVLLATQHRPRAGWGLFDTAFIGAAVLWAVLALGTGLLLRLASGIQGPLSEPFPCVFLLCCFVVCLYLCTRFLSCRGSVPEVLQCLLGLWMMMNALTHWPT